ncbi:MAG: DNA (cytosine-5-)-methyltransferase [Actinomycetia bacterium]|nr:DNA (cytosine-5-)-methyltransferase [Actinomycetes bacterium]
MFQARAMVTAPFTFADLFAGIGGFHAVLSHAGGRCVFVSEIDQEALATYRRNWLPAGDGDVVVNEDITTATPETGDLVGVPRQIDVLAAGFPCQPFSKSGRQAGMDEARGTLFWNIARVLEERHPSVILLENVRNLAGPRHRHEWDVIVRELHRIGYRVSATPSVFSPHFLPPSRGGTPQVRDRVFLLGTFVGPGRAPDPSTVPPTLVREPVAGWDPQRWRTEWVLDSDDEVDHRERYDLTVTERAWIDHWDLLVQSLPPCSERSRLPGFPLWADHWVTESSLDPRALEKMPSWKADFLVKNARFYDQHRRFLNSWLADPVVQTMPPTRRKLEWQAQNATSLWDTVMHFRPSGIRAKRPTYLPALVAITQTSIIGPRQRRITPHEGARLQGLPKSFTFGDQRDAASYKQVGNGVCVGAAWYALRRHVERDQADIPTHIVHAVLQAPDNPSPDALAPAAHA